VNVEGHESFRIDVALRERDQVLHGKVVDRQLEIRSALLWQQPIDEDSAVAVVPELELVDFESRRPPMNA
jgi:hypothetical protein